MAESKEKLKSLMIKVKEESEKAGLKLSRMNKCIRFLMLGFLDGPSLTSVHDYWENHSFDYVVLCQQSNISAF